MASFFITGASRGFGLALVRELLSRPTSEVAKIFASARGPSPALDDIARGSPHRVVVVGLDVTSEACAKRAASEVEAHLHDKGLDVLINNAGIAQYAVDGAKSMENLQESFLIDVMDVHWTTQAFLPLLQRGQLKKVANISTTFGSLALAPAVHFMPAPAYKITKTALNALTVQYALDHAKDGFSFMAVCPSWMKTDLGGGDMADLTPEEGARASLEIIYKPNGETNGQLLKVFVDGWQSAQGPNVYDGLNAPW